MKQNLFDINGYVVVITGGTGVLGRTIAKYLAGQGAKVAILGRKEDVGNSIVEEITSAGGEASFYKTDVMNKETLEQNRAGKTTILIAHRITTIESMDKIIFVDDGRILAVGSHDELVRSCPEYSRMVELQKLENEAGGAENA